MFTLVIIDDEAFTAELLSNLLDWEALDFTLTASFSNSKEALKFIQHNPPHLILTDIKMPVVSGTDIAKYCYEHLPNTSVVFISSHSDFYFSKFAIQHNVIDYILKPITKTGLTNSMKEIHKKLLMKERTLQSATPSMPSEIMALKMQTLFYNLMSGEITEEQDLKKGLEDIGLDQNYTNKACCIACISITDFENYTQNIWKYGKTRLYYAISSIVYEAVPGYRFILVRYSDQILELCGIPHTLSAFDQTDQQLLEAIKNSLAELITLPIKIESITHFSNLMLLKNYTLSEFDVNPLLKNRVIQKVNDFIAANYKKKFSVVDVANYVSLSYAYFSNYYKKCTNENFTDTLNRYRIEQAKKLLLDSDNIKTSVIGMEVGFTHRGYFNKIFKSLTGCTPSEYRAKHLNSGC